MRFEAKQKVPLAIKFSGRALELRYEDGFGFSIAPELVVAADSLPDLITVLNGLEEATEGIRREVEELITTATPLA